MTGFFFNEEKIYGGLNYFSTMLIVIAWMKVILKTVIESRGIQLLKNIGISGFPSSKYPNGIWINYLWRGILILFVSIITYGELGGGAGCLCLILFGCIIIHWGTFPEG